MSRPAKEWFSAQELADMALPGMPSTKRGVQALATANGWADAKGADGPLSRPRAGRGGGVEYHLAVLPASARNRLMAGHGEAQAAPLAREEAWARYERLPASVKAEAARRLAVIGEVEKLVRLGLKQTCAIDQVVRNERRVADAERRAAGLSTRAIWDWMRRIHGADPIDRLAYLAPAYQGRTAKLELPNDAWDIYVGDYLRQSRPTHAHCYRNLQRKAAEEGWTLPSPKTLARRLDAEVTPNIQTLYRQGPEALMHAYPHRDRARSGLAPMQILNLDGQTWDVRVLWPDGAIARPVSMTIQDIYSSRIVAIRFDLTLSQHLVRLTLGDAFRAHGVCDEILMDNGRENTAASISGGQHRMRWGKTPEEDPAGLLKTLGIRATFAKPRWGQAKPVERAHRDFAHDIAKRAEFEGAYTGHNTSSKPENYGSRAVPFAEFEAIVRRELEFYNAQEGRTGIGKNGRSFDQVFADGLAARPPKRLTEEQLRLCMLTSKAVSMDPKTGAVKVEGHRYWSPELGDVQRQKVTVRFDPERMDLPAAIYAQDGRLLAMAERVQAGSFDNLFDGREQGKALRDFNRATKAQAAALRRLTPQDVAAQLASPAPPEPMQTGEKVVALVPRAPRRAAQAGPTATDLAKFNDAFEQAAAALGGAG